MESPTAICGDTQLPESNRFQKLPMFRDHRTVGAWLPKTMYITRFQENGFRPIATFD